MVVAADVSEVVCAARERLQAAIGRSRSLWAPRPAAVLQLSLDRRGQYQGVVRTQPSCPACPLAAAQRRQQAEGGVHVVPCFLR